MKSQGDKRVTERATKVTEGQLKTQLKAQPQGGGCW